MTPAEAQLHIRYTNWASNQLLDAVAALSAEDRERANGISHGSILGTLAHVMFADWIWYTRVVAPIDRPAETLEVLQRDWPDIQRRWEAWSDSLTDAALDRFVSFKRANGAESGAPVWQIVLHVVNHGTLHRGQVMGMLRQLGVAPPATDLIRYYLNFAAGKATA
ncbi:MAG TPA: DinB family protein [Bryobacteraceae bacterium]|jgi:uncharacterized damage-inducible protein DinB|nr:DinB family protein [Bryobacteraceae bacterium]